MAMLRFICLDCDFATSNNIAYFSRECPLDGGKLIQESDEENDREYDYPERKYDDDPNDPQRFRFGEKQRLR